MRCTSFPCLPLPLSILCYCLTVILLLCSVSLLRFLFLKTIFCCSCHCSLSFVFWLFGGPLLRSSASCGLCFNSSPPQVSSWLKERNTSLSFMTGLCLFVLQYFVSYLVTQFCTLPDKTPRFRLVSQAWLYKSCFCEVFPECCCSPSI